MLVPTFNDPNDRLALNILADLFPDREIIPIYCGDLIWGLGAIHCMTSSSRRKAHVEWFRPSGLRSGQAVCHASKNAAQCAASLTPDY